LSPSLSLSLSLRLLTPSSLDSCPSSSASNATKSAARLANANLENAPQQPPKQCRRTQCHRARPCTPALSAAAAPLVNRPPQGNVRTVDRPAILELIRSCARN